MSDPTQLLPAQDGPLAWLILLASSVIEYLFPPFPGDTVTLFGAFLVTARGWSFAAVLASSTLGSGLGAMLDFRLGIAAQRRRNRKPGQGPLQQQTRQKLDWLIERFRRHGAWFIVVNRFLPGVRAFFFVAAGMAGMKPWPVFLYSLLSALLWNLLIMLAGMGLGVSWPTLYGLFVRYTQLVWLLLGTGVLVAAALVLRSRWQRRRDLARGVDPVALAIPTEEKQDVKPSG